MPTVHVVWKPRDTQTKRKVAERFLQTLVDEAKCPPEAVHIMFHDTPPENFLDAAVLNMETKK